MIFVIGGPGKTGSSTISHMLARDLNAEHVYTGGIMREQAVQAHFIRADISSSQISLDAADIPGFRSYCKLIGRDIDAEVDRISMSRVIAAHEQNRPLVMDSKLAAKLINSPAGVPFIAQTKGYDAQQISDCQNYQLSLQRNTRAVWLTARFRVRALRALRKQHSEVEPEESALDAEVNILQLRQQNDALTYLSKYGITDYPVDDLISPEPDYGTVVDNTDHVSIIQTYEQIITVLGIVL